MNVRTEILNHLNLAEECPKSGDVIVIETKRFRGERVVLRVAEVLYNEDGKEVIVNKSRNKYFNWGMYRSGESWVWRVWNLGQAKLTSSTNTMKKLDDM
ncbi:hypothetical protein [Vibrio phage LP.1]|nr:hypothetical protein [Vibrio phage LP.1]